jgi:acyl carrier protein
MNYHGSIQTGRQKMIVDIIFGVIANYEHRNYPISDASEIGLNYHFSDDLGMDSLDNVEVWVDIERKLGVEVPSGDIEELRSVEAWDKYLRDKVPKECD